MTKADVQRHMDATLEALRRTAEAKEYSEGIRESIFEILGCLDIAKADNNVDQFNEIQQLLQFALHQDEQAKSAAERAAHAVNRSRAITRRAAAVDDEEK